jgi:hypothetical protein
VARVERHPRRAAERERQRTGIDPGRDPLGGRGHGGGGAGRDDEVGAAAGDLAGIGRQLIGGAHGEGHEHGEERARDSERHQLPARGEVGEPGHGRAR